jgi:hypothetical protein
LVSQQATAGRAGDDGALEIGGMKIIDGKVTIFIDSGEVLRVLNQVTIFMDSAEL